MLKAHLLHAAGTAALLCSVQNAMTAQPPAGGSGQGSSGYGAGGQTGGSGQGSSGYGGGQGGAEQPPPAGGDAGGGAIVAFTHAETGQAVVVDAASVTHVQPTQGAKPHDDPTRASRGELGHGWVTEIGTVGGLVLRVLESVKEVCQALGWGGL